ncbi:MAG TPA: ABC transporter permease [Tenuifilaceae bacterium]|jgi:peptide/nickel transport system permease protein|nr:ABC transporter permease [Bacteroidales bacterium]MDI9515397.1 ABC transporter permease [Bacteroidota bacterium]NLH57247.1 ABC transporter permease [Rikenellaceae bacterium]OQC62861.1 MAG: Glutathione transport system permease protein GsiD [Bacteroidetes bacterium ADurb.Bin008]HNV81804.1 ABC transporter permease [Tenuifilaceae bacterium]
MVDIKGRSGSPWRIAAGRFVGNRLSLASALFIGLVALIAIFGYLIVPDSTPGTNNQHLELATKKPGFACRFFLIPGSATTQRVGIIKKFFRGQSNPYREVPILSHAFQGWDIVLTEYVEPDDSITIVSNYGMAGILFLEIKQEDMVFATDSLFINTDGVQSAFSRDELIERVERNHIVRRKFWLGTDRFGRDMLSRLIIGSRVSLSVGFVAVAISLLIGITLGATAGYFRGWYDDVVMWLVNVVWSIPTLLMVIALTMVLGKGFWQIFVAVGLTMWVEVARVVRGQVMSLREKEFVEAAKVMGFSTARIIFKHILPNVLGPVAIIAAGNFATAILLEAGLGFLGIGVQPPTPSWGTMIKDHYGYIIMDKPFLAILPGVAIMLLVLAFTLMGNGLRDALDPREA